MAKITRVKRDPRTQRIYVDVDGRRCCSVRGRTWSAMNLQVGSKITCAELKEREKFHWKRQYQSTWPQEQIRLQHVTSLVQRLDSRVTVERVGFGADTTDFIAAHPETKGDPDLRVDVRADGRTVLWIEVTGTDSMRGADYWVRPDKLAATARYAEPVWVALHYRRPVERTVFLLPDRERVYAATDIPIRGSVERYVLFNEHSPEYHTVESFAAHMQARLRDMGIPPQRHEPPDRQLRR